MCFSPQADVVAGLVVGAVGADALRHVRRRSEWPVAALPVILGAHQLVESLVWWGLRGRVSAAVWHPAVRVYLVIAFGVVPLLVPVAVRALQPERLRRRLDGFVAGGAVVAGLLTYPVLRGPVHATIEGHHIAYGAHLWQGGLLAAVYIVVTCGAMLASWDRDIRYFGVVNLMAVLVLAWLTESGFVSLWCAWAAVTSILIAAHLRRAPRPPRLRVVPAHN